MMQKDVKWYENENKKLSNGCQTDKQYENLASRAVFIGFYGALAALNTAR